MYEVVKVYSDDTECIMFQNMTEHEACLLSYNLNMFLPINTKYFHEAREQKTNVPINLRIRR